METKEYNFNQEFKDLEQFLIGIGAEKIDAYEKEGEIYFYIGEYNFQIENYTGEKNSWKISAYECPVIDNGFMFWEGEPDWFLMDWNMNFEDLCDYIVEIQNQILTKTKW